VSSTALAATLAFVAGLAGATQIAVQGRLAERIGSIEAVACASVLGAVCAVGVLLVARRSLGGLWDGAAGPKWQLLGGVMSALIIFAITVAGPRIGVLATTGIVIAAQFALAALIDRLGWFGVERVPLGAARLTGLVLLASGAALVLRR
jgi:transporter family-2 protein